MLSMTTRSELRRQEWQDLEIRARRTEGNRRAAIRRYKDPEERRKASERTTATLQNPDLRRRNRAHLDALNKSRRGKPAGALGLHGTPEYKIWLQMNQRCSNPKARQYEDYGGRGISVCPEWQGRGGFARFYRHIGPRPSPIMTIGRIDNDGDYEPENVRWETRLEQGSNSRKNRLVMIAGETKHLARWAREAGISPPTLAYRIKAGWPEERWLEPPQKRQV